MKFSFPHEPAIWLGLIRALVVLGTTFGLQLTVDQIAAIYGFVEIASTLVQRSQVTPNAKLSEATIAKAELSPPGPKA